MSSPSLTEIPQFYYNKLARRKASVETVKDSAAPVLESKGILFDIEYSICYNNHKEP